MGIYLVGDLGTSVNYIRIGAGAGSCVVGVSEICWQRGRELSGARHAGKAPRRDGPLSHDVGRISHEVRLDVVHLSLTSQLAKNLCKGERAEVGLASSLDAISFLRFSSKHPTYPFKVPILNCSPTPVSSGPSLSARAAAASVCAACAHSRCSWRASSGMCCLNTTMYWLGMASAEISDMAGGLFFI